MEIWKKLNWLEPFYVSNYGNVKCDSRVIHRNGKYCTLKAKICKLTVDNRGYKTVRCNNKLYRVHRLVAMAFIDNSHNKPYINHIDGNTSNNYINNLEWCTQKENVRHAVRIGLLKNQNNNGMSKSINQICTNTNKVLKTYLSAAEAGRQLNLNGNSISRCANGFRKTAFGFKWEYI